VRKMRYKLPKGVTLNIVDDDALRRDRQDSAFYTWWDTNRVADLAYEGREYGIYCVGEMRIHYKEQVIRYCDDLIQAGIKNDKDLSKIEDNDGEWLNNSWFEVWDEVNDEYTGEVYHTVQDAIESVANWIVDKEEANVL
jgi:hypothetical protein